MAESRRSKWTRARAKKWFAREFPYDKIESHDPSTNKFRLAYRLGSNLKSVGWGRFLFVNEYEQRSASPS
jgi:hypothetical protein